MEHCLEGWKSKSQKRRKEDMRVGRIDEQRVIVSIKLARRARIGEKKSNGKPYKADQMIYETVDSIDVFEATGEQVLEAVNNGLKIAASKR
jgi:hypothetical protein